MRWSADIRFGRDAGRTGREDGNGIKSNLNLVLAFLNSVYGVLFFFIQVRAGDRLVEVNGRDVGDLCLNDVVPMLQVIL